MTTTTLERPTTQPTALYQLAARIGVAVDSEGTPITDAAASQILDTLVQQRILSDPNLSEVVQELLDDLRFTI